MSIENKITKRSLTQIEKITGSKLTLGKLIWSIRECEEMTQVKFAKKLGVSKQHICDVEHDRKNISPKTAANYAKILGYPQEQFIRLALQNIVDQDGLGVIVKLEQKRAHAHRCA